jgi:hypothetical protein
VFEDLFCAESASEIDTREPDLTVPAVWVEVGWFRAKSL